MKGVIFNAVEEAVTDLYSADTWDDLLDLAGLTGEYTSLGTYDDAELFQLVGAAHELTGIEANELVRILGQHAFPHLASRLPDLCEGAASTHEFLRRVNDIIHPEVLKLHPDAAPPEFFFEDRPDGSLRVTYKSARKLGVLAEGLIHGAAAQYGETVAIDVVSGAGEAVTVFDVAIIASAEKAA